MRTLSSSPQPAVLSYRQAAHYLGLPSVDALRMMVYRRRAPPSISFGMRDRRFRVVDIDRWLAAKAAAAIELPPAPAAPPKRGRPTKVEQARRQAMPNYVHNSFRGTLDGKRAQP